MEAQFSCRYIGQSNDLQVVHLLVESSQQSLSDIIPAGTISIYTNKPGFFFVDKKYKVTIEEVQ